MQWYSVMVILSCIFVMLESLIVTIVWYILPLIIDWLLFISICMSLIFCFCLVNLVSEDSELISMNFFFPLLYFMKICDQIRARSSLVWPKSDKVKLDSCQLVSPGWYMFGMEGKGGQGKVFKNDGTWEEFFLSLSN